MLGFLREVYREGGHSQEQSRLSGLRLVIKVGDKKQREAGGFEAGGCSLALQSL